jgi:hypothetical protein
MASVNNTPGTLNITLYRGDTYYAIATVKDNGGTAINLTNYSIKAEIYGPDLQPLTFTSTATVTQKQRELVSGTTYATLTLSQNHNFDTNQTITVAGVGVGWDGTRVITSVTATTITYQSTGTVVTQENATGTVTSSVKAEFQIGNKASEITGGKIHMFLPDGVSKRLPDNAVYDLEIARKTNLTDFGDDANNAFDDHWTVQTILKGEIDVVEDITYSVTASTDTTRGQLT